MKTTETSYEDKIARLKEIVNTLQNNDLPISEFSTLYYEGLKLVQEISEQLDSIKGEIERVTNSFNQQVGSNLNRDYN